MLHNLPFILCSDSIAIAKHYSHSFHAPDTPRHSGHTTGNGIKSTKLKTPSGQILPKPSAETVVVVVVVVVCSQLLTTSTSPPSCQEVLHISKENTNHQTTLKISSLWGVSPAPAQPPDDRLLLLEHFLDARSHLLMRISMIWIRLLIVATAITAIIAIIAIVTVQATATATAITSATAACVYSLTTSLTSLWLKSPPLSGRPSRTPMTSVVWRHPGKIRYWSLSSSRTRTRTRGKITPHLPLSLPLILHI